MYNAKQVEPGRLKAVGYYIITFFLWVKRMVTVQIVSAKGKKLPFIKSLPASLEFPGKAAADVKVADIKGKLAEKYPKVSVNWSRCNTRNLTN